MTSSTVETDVNDRITQIISFYGLNKNSFSKKIGIDNSVTIRNIVGGRRSKPGYEVLEKIINNCPEINVVWLMTGKGSIDSDSGKNSIEDYTVNEIMDHISNNEIEFLENSGFKYFLRWCFEKYAVKATERQILDYQNKFKSEK